MAELEERNNSYMNQYCEWTHYEDPSFDPSSVCIDLEEFRHIYPRLNSQEFIELLENKRYVVLLNRSVWRNTLASEVTPDIVREIIRLKRNKNEAKDL